MDAAEEDIGKIVFRGDSTRLDSTRLGSARLGSARLGSALLDSTRLDSTRLGSTRGDSRRGEATSSTHRLGARELLPTRRVLFCDAIMFKLMSSRLLQVREAKIRMSEFPPRAHLRLSAEPAAANARERCTSVTSVTAPSLGARRLPPPPRRTSSKGNRRMTLRSTPSRLESSTVEAKRARAYRMLR